MVKKRKKPQSEYMRRKSAAKKGLRGLKRFEREHREHLQKEQEAFDARNMPVYLPDIEELP
jgi:hypothetical protein